MLSTSSPATVVVLHDGTPARVRLVRPDDRDRILRGVREMSGTSRYMRFFTSRRDMSEEQARYFTEIDQVNHVAVCAVEATKAEERGYGISRFVRDDKEPHIAEFAVAVIDEMQHRGLGTVLLAALYLRAQQRGIHELRGDVLAENPAMLKWMPRLGATIETTSEAGCHLIRWPIVAGKETLPKGIDADFMLWLDWLRPDFAV